MRSGVLRAASSVIGRGGQRQQQLRMSTVVPAAERLAGSSPSVWVEFGALAKKHEALNVGQGFPDYASCPAYVQRALAEATVQKPLLNQYTRGFGHPPLVQQLSSLYSKLLSRGVDANEEILVTVGAYQALFYSIFAFVNPGDEVLLLEPYYDCYEPQVRMAGGHPIGVPLRLKPGTGKETERCSSELEIDWAELESKFTAKTKMLVLNNPHNPTGKLFTREELERVAALAIKHNILVLADEVYEWLAYPPGQTIRMATLPGMWERTISIGSAGKTFSVTGWKLGWAIAAKPLMQQLHFAHQNCVYTCPTTVQEAVAQGFAAEIPKLGTGESYFETISEELRPKRDAFVAACKDAGLVPIVPQSGYFMLADTTAVKAKMPPNYGDPAETEDYRFAKWLTAEKGLAAIPPSAFYSPPNKALGKDAIRFCFFKDDNTVKNFHQLLVSIFK